MKSSPFNRALELAKLAAQVGMKELRSGDAQSRYQQAMVIAKSLSHMKGAAMKAGQLLSLDLDHYFPPEAIEVLSQLQNSARAHPYSEMESLLRKELGTERFKKLKNFSHDPIAVASIGQVHTAELEGEKVAVKVQYAEVAGSVDSDLKILKTLAGSFCRITGREMDLDPLFREFKSVLEQELDYKREAQFLEEFSHKLIHFPAVKGVHLKVPSGKSEFSTGRVLVQSFEAGVSLREWIQQRPSLEKKKLMGKTILDLYFYEFFSWGLVQTDPNLANFLVEDRGSHLQLCLLDFGATRCYDLEFRKTYIELLEASLNGNQKQLRKLAIGMGLMDPRESETAFLAFEDVIGGSLLPLFSKSQKSREFDFSDPQYLLKSQSTVQRLAKELVYSPPPSKLVFLHRKLAGVYSVLKMMELKLEISEYWEKMRDLVRESKTTTSGLR